jgi:hypothetical protein
MPHLFLSPQHTLGQTHPLGRLWGSRTPPLPARVPILGLSLALRKSLAGFLTALCHRHRDRLFLLELVRACCQWSLGLDTRHVQFGCEWQSVGGRCEDCRQIGFESLPTGDLAGLAIVSFPVL